MVFLHIRIEKMDHCQIRFFSLDCVTGNCGCKHIEGSGIAGQHQTPEFKEGSEYITGCPVPQHTSDAFDTGYMSGNFDKIIADIHRTAGDRI